MLIDDSNPRKMKLDKRELPPNDTNGKVTPTIGTIPIFIPILKKAGIMIMPNAHAENTRTNVSLLREKIK